MNEGLVFNRKSNIYFYTLDLLRCEHILNICHVFTSYQEFCSSLTLPQKKKKKTHIAEADFRMFSHNAIS